MRSKLLIVFMGVLLIWYFWPRAKMEFRPDFVPEQNPVDKQSSLPQKARLEEQKPAGNGKSLRLSFLNEPKKKIGNDRIQKRKFYSEIQDVVEFEVVGGLAVAHGDIILGTLPNGFSERTGFHKLDRPDLWPSRDIPYLIQQNLPQEKIVRQVIEYLNETTSVRLVPYIGGNDAIVFSKGEKHCLSPLGRTGGLQPILLSSACGFTEILHEILHSLGFPHEQALPYRDEYIEVIWDNIDEKYWNQFAILGDQVVSGLRYTNLRFDFQSIMLYPQSLFAKKPGLETLRSKTGEPVAPVRGRLSEGDIQRLNDIY